MEKMYKVVTEMPKVELHAHLNGSISDELLTHLKNFAENDATPNDPEFPDADTPGVLMDPKHSQSSQEEVWSDHSNKTRSIAECWEAFGKIQGAIRTPKILYVATLNVIAEFSRDNVIYLELRTGAKKFHSIPSKLDYVEAVVKGIQVNILTRIPCSPPILTYVIGERRFVVTDYREEKLFGTSDSARWSQNTFGVVYSYALEGQRKFPIIVKLLLTINRELGEECIPEILQLAKIVQSKYPDILVGIDISGNPNTGHWSWIVKGMQEARKMGFKISCHLPEIVNPEEGIEFMKFGPERVGHGQFLHHLYGGSEELWELAKEKRIPIETCISSNLVSGVAKSLDSHIVQIFHKESLPFSICTDDSGVFRTTLSNEYKKFLTVSNVNLNDLYRLSMNAISYTFASTEEKAELTNQTKKWWTDQIPSLNSH